MNIHPLTAFSAASYPRLSIISPGKEKDLINLKIGFTYIFYYHILVHHKQ